MLRPVIAVLIAALSVGLSRAPDGPSRTFWPVILLFAIDVEPAMITDDLAPDGYATLAQCRARVEQMETSVRTRAPAPYLAGKTVTMASNCLTEPPQVFFRRVFGDDGGRI